MNRLLNLPLAGILAAALACATQPRAGTIEGTWSVASATVAGREVPPAVFEGTPLRLTGGRYVFQNDTGAYVVIPGTSPGAIDVRGERGPNAGKTIPAIFRLQGDTLVICYDLSGAARPSAFRSDSGTSLFLARYVRAAP